MPERRIPEPRGRYAGAMPAYEPAPPSPAPRFFAGHPRLVDTAAVVFTIVLPTIGLATGVHHGRHGLDASDVVAAVVFAALVFLRHRWPLHILIVGAVAAAVITLASADRTVAIPAMLVLIYSMTVRTPRTTALVAGAAATTLIFLAAAFRLDHAWFAPDSFAVLAWSGLALAAGDAVRSRRDYIAAVIERARRAEETRETEARRRVTEERLRIARELHDVVAHHMAVINVQAGVAAHLLRDNPDGAERALGTVRDAGRSVLQELNGVLNVLRNAEDDDTPATPLPTLAQLDELLASFADAGLRVDFHTAGAVAPMSEALQLTVYRVVEEALTNAHKYGDGRATVRVAHHPTAVDLCIENRVVRAPAHVGAPDSASGGHGLIGMHERVAAVNGTLEVGPEPNNAFGVRVHLPVHQIDEQ
jgi:signal transduction histidine kinase